MVRMPPRIVQPAPFVVDMVTSTVSCGPNVRIIEPLMSPYGEPAPTMDSSSAPDVYRFR